MAIHSETAHMLLVVFPLLILADGFRPDIRQLHMVCLFLLAACVPAVALNETCNTNFMFLNRTGGNPLLELFAALFGKQLYVIGVGILLVIVMALMYLPWMIKRKPKVNA